jgi:hypothetical protein
MKLDRFTWVVIGIVVVLIAAAVFTVARTGGAGWESATYLEEDTPDAPVYNAFLALQRGDRTRARAQYTQAIIDATEREFGPDPFSARGGDQSSRLRIVKVEIDDQDPDRARVSYVQDTYNRGGPFGAGDTWSREGTVEVIREEGEWKINAQEFFY